MSSYFLIRSEFGGAIDSATTIEDAFAVAREYRSYNPDESVEICDWSGCKLIARLNPSPFMASL
jgi:hypothetical protein